MSETVSRDLALAIDAARKGGEVVAGSFRMGHSPEEKAGNRGLVTETDKASERVIMDVLGSGSPHSILSEETGRSAGSSELLWVVDPLDGTTNFARGVPLFAVSIALMREHEVCLGVVVNPLTNECFYAERGSGCYRDGQRIRVSSNADESRSVLCVNHGYGESDRRRCAAVTERLVRGHYIRKLGTTALELSHLASGALDAFICSGDELWDFAAGIVLVEEAGGRFTDWRGNRWDGSNTFVLATNGRLHGPLVERIGDLQDAGE